MSGPHQFYLPDQARHVRNEVSALPDTRDKLSRDWLPPKIGALI